MRWLTYLVWWVLVFLGLDYALSVLLTLQLGIQLRSVPTFVFLTPMILAAARLTNWGLTRTVSLPRSYAGWPYGIALGALALIVANFALAYFTLLKGRSASGLPPPLSILVGSLAILASEIKDWLSKVASLPPTQIAPTLAVYVLGFVALGIVNGYIRALVGNIGLIVVLPAYLLGLSQVGRFVALRASKNQ